MDIGARELIDSALRLAVAAGVAANYCDHVEHNEPADIEAVRRVADELRRMAIELSGLARRDPFELYASRLEAIEERNVLFHEGSFHGALAAQSAGTWRDLQLAQSAHDKAYHGDVVGLAKADQLRHYALHIAKLAGATAEVASNQSDQADWLRRRVPDMLLFGIKLATVSGQKLPKDPLPRASGPVSAALSNEPSLVSASPLS